ncbi:DNA polymerase IV [Pseudomonas citronellolis]|uniref:DNA polymerase IV n=1 Tax=Pseudomonas citronellolis TaxID=53408 RepID=UPI0023E45690|nr:DNA polymerase IV [Pseudomonas citronellolis]MDF3932827.1 DNA polymerase IV [Pseudomonas citronellolis]
MSVAPRIAERPSVRAGSALSSRQRKIIHIDCDCFYAAIEMRDDPSLAGKPLAVGGSPDKRGVVATCNYEARAYGLHSAMAMRTAVKLCPDLTIVRPRMDVYKGVSREIHAIFRDYTDLIEPLSLDEAYLDVSDCQQFSGSATLIAQDIRRRVWLSLGITVSAGVAPNKFLAKIASDWRKPNGQFVITPDQVEAFVAALPVKKLHGVGKVTAEKLARLGVQDCLQLRDWSRLALVREFGGFGERLWNLARGLDERPVQVDSRRQSISVENTFDRDLPDVDACLAELPGLLDELQRRMQRLDASYRPGKPFVKLKFHDFTQTTLEQAGASRDLDSYRLLLTQAFQRGERPVRLIGVGVRLEDLRGKAEQLTLF